VKRYNLHMYLGQQGYADMALAPTGHYVLFSDAWPRIAKAQEKLHLARIEVAELQRQLAQAQEALRRIREAGNNTTEWATWAQRTAAWGMQTGYCPEQPKDAP
jgi:septation ring formation regulator EzrA